MGRVLIAGCGYVGAAAAKLFQGAGWSVEGWTRGGQAELEPGPRCLMRAINLEDANQVRTADGTFDLVIHSASTRGGDATAYRRIYLEGARHLCERFAEAAMIFVSSTSVYAQRSGEWVTEESAAQPESETGRILREAEDHVLQRGGTVARFAGLYGPGRSALLQRVLRGEAVIDPHEDRFVNQLHRDDAAAALFFLGIKRSAPGGQIYNVADNTPLLLSECYRWLAGKLDRPLTAVGAAPRAGKRGESNKRVNNAKLRQ
ncbi:MAG TPA: NAD-dependent epimerase/dehydratase family protein, partial [Chthoniobacterales bacterium]